MTGADYLSSVVSAFGHACLYCNRELEHDRAAVEHFDGMNRFRVGLHVPGNVAVACRRCNNEKRRDDQLVSLHLATSGWESFLSHDGTRCDELCKTCSYWASIWGDLDQRKEMLYSAKLRIQTFRTPFANYIAWSAHARSAIKYRVEALYRACQEFATVEIAKLTNELNFDFDSSSLHD